MMRDQFEDQSITLAVSSTIDQPLHTTGGSNDGLGTFEEIEAKSALRQRASVKIRCLRAIRRHAPLQIAPPAIHSGVNRSSP
jgi:hypothetical protein